MKCANCGRDIDRPYHSEGVQAVEQVMITNPDGSGQTWTPKAIVACSWLCLAVCVETVVGLYDELAAVVCGECGTVAKITDRGCTCGVEHLAPLFTRRADVQRGARGPDEEPF